MNTKDYSSKMTMFKNYTLFKSWLTLLFIGLLILPSLHAESINNQPNGLFSKAITQLKTQIAQNIQAQGLEIPKNFPTSFLMDSDGDRVNDNIDDTDVTPSTLLSNETNLATFFVTTGADSGAGSLRQAILDANANPGLDFITFNTGLTVLPTSTLPTITQQTTINGNNSTVNGGNAGSVSGLDFAATADNSVLNNLNVTNFVGAGIILQGDIADQLTGMTLTNNSTNGNGSGSSSFEGLRLQYASSNSITGHTSNNNFSYGISLSFNCDNNTVSNATLTGNGTMSAAAGLTIDSDSDNNLVENSTITGNAGGGIWLRRNSNSNSIVNNQITSNARIGIFITESDDSYIFNNAIHLNAGIGVGVDSGEQNQISQNSIYDNTGIGIDLNEDNVSPNDGTTTAGSANILLDFPVFTATTYSGGVLMATGTAPIGSTVEIFVSDGDASGHGEGEAYLTTATANGSGDFSFSTAIGGLSYEDLITATSTDALDNTSEFSTQFVAVIPLTIEAIDDDFTGSPVVTGERTATILINDELDGGALPATDALVTTPTVIANGGLTGVTINSDGTVNVPPSAGSGTYSGAQF